VKKLGTKTPPPKRSSTALRPAVAADRAPQPDPAGTRARCRWWQPPSPQELIKIIQHIQDSMKIMDILGIFWFCYSY